MKNNNLLIGASLLLSLAVIVLLLNSKKKWNCVEGKCEQSLFGVHDTESDCINSCAYSYICDNNKQCVQVPGKDTGPYQTEAECKSNCVEEPTTQVYTGPYPYYSYLYPSYYYPQSLRRPYYWTPRGRYFRRGRRGRRRRRR